MSPPLLADQVSARPLPARRTPRFTRSIDFAALPTALTCTRLFVASTLQRWGALSEVVDELLGLPEPDHRLAPKLC